jgi:hypothetical protein
MIHPFVIWKGKLLVSRDVYSRHTAKSIHRAEVVRKAKEALARGEGYF